MRGTIQTGDGADVTTL